MMKIKNLMLYLLIFSVFLPSVLGAKVSGNIYGPYLDPLTNVVVSVDTVPKQTTVSRDGSYSFNLESGDYLITAKHAERSYAGEEKVTIINGGDFNLDIILFEDLSKDDISEDSVEIPPELSGVKSIWTYILIAWFVLVGVIFYILKYVKPSGSDLDEELDEIVQFIKKNKGRTTQKEIRKNFHWSEAKISLIIAELEDKKVVKKIKKGRSNIIILEKK